MCFKKQNNKPVRLAKKQPNEKLEMIKFLIKQPEFWVMVVIIIALIICIILAFKESISSLVYNNGGLF